MSRKISLTIIIFIAGLLLVVLAGCGGNQSKTQGAGKGSEAAKPGSPAPGNAASAPAGNASDKQKLVLATNPPGSSYYSVAVAQSNMVGKKTNLNIIVQPTAGPTAIPKVVFSGEAQLGTGAGPTLFWAYEGTHAFKEPFPGIRLLQSGNDTPHVYLVNKKSGINSITDLKGKRVTIDYPTFPTTDILAKGILEAYGLKTSDVKALKAESTSAAIEDLVNGRADAVITSLGGAKLLEAATKIDLGLVPFDPRKVMDYFGPKMPAIYPSKGPKGYGVGEGQPAVGFSSLIWASDKLTDEIAYQIVKTLMENQAELANSGPAELKEWTKEVAVRKLGIPYHPGAIKYYKEAGLWDKSLDEYQQKVLANAK